MWIISCLTVLGNPVVAPIGGSPVFIFSVCLSFVCLPIINLIPPYTAELIKDHEINIFYMH